MHKFIKLKERLTKTPVYVNAALIREIANTNATGAPKATLFFTDGTTKYVEQSADQVYRMLT